MWIVAPIPKNPASKVSFAEKLIFFCVAKVFVSKSFQIRGHFFPLLFPKDSENLNFLDIGLWEVRAKRRLNEVNKWRKKCLFLPQRFYTLYEQKFSNMRPLLSITFPQGFLKSKKFEYWTSGSGVKIPLNGVRNADTKKVLLSKAKFAQKQFFCCAAILHPLLEKLFISETTFFITFPQGFWISENFGHPTLGSGGKKTA